MNQAPSIGRIVHFVLANGQHRAATVVNCWPSADPTQASTANLTVHLDGCNDLQTARSNGDSFGDAAVLPGMCKPELIPQGAAALYAGSLVVGSASQDEETHAPGTWHWPERT